MLSTRSRAVSGLLASALAFASAFPLEGGAAEPRPFKRTELRESCKDSDPLRRPFFGDLHVHTAISLDASTQGTIKRPADAYGFARGEVLEIQPYDAEGRGRRRLKLGRPLDFAAITDHVELMGEVHICSTPNAPGYDSWVCRMYRGWPRLAYYAMNTRSSMGSAADPPTRWGFCGERGEDCLAAARIPWQETRDAAEAAYDRSATCGFTSFIGYEWTGAGEALGTNMHRNVIFRNDHVPEQPTGYVSAPHPELLWKALARDCADAGTGCEVVVIPHNSNLSGGDMFSTERLGGGKITRAEGEARARFELLAEIMQHKGESECMIGLETEDELCGFEKLATKSFGERNRFFGGEPEPPTARQFLRHTLKAGLSEQERIGVNPFRYGIIASTDTHLAAPGAADESENYAGHGGAGTPARDEIPPGLPDEADFNPGGLAVAWAEENSRDAIFAALQRRETYGTSGTRPTVRFFGGWDYPSGLCERRDLVPVGYRNGVPMGGELEAPTTRQAARGPRFVLAALRDSGTRAQPGTPLQRTQIIKGWIDASGNPRERVYEVSGDPENGASVDTATCGPRGTGADTLCSVWTDPDFHVDRPAFYYARVVENPTCRWTQRLCNAGGVDCAKPETVTEGFAPCCDSSVPATVQERAWTSPIWYTPAKSASE